MVSAVVLSSLLGISVAASAELPARSTDAGDSVSVADLYVMVNQLRGDIELVRLELGKPRAAFAELQVRHATLREVYFVSTTLYRKTDQLAFELLRNREELPEVEVDEEIDSQHVQDAIAAAADRIRAVKENLGITEMTPLPRRDPTVNERELLSVVLRASRQLNLIVQQRITSGDVYQVLTQAVAYTAELRRRFPDARIPESPLFERRKRPADVFRRMINCLDTIGDIAEASEIPMMKLESADYEGISSGDIYDIGGLILAELSDLHSSIPDAEEIPPAPFPGFRLPSHAYQRASLLLAQLEELERLARQDPDWVINPVRRKSKRAEAVPGEVAIQVETSQSMTKRRDEDVPADGDPDQPSVSTGTETLKPESTESEAED